LIKATAVGQPAPVMQLISSLGVGGAERLLIEFLRANRRAEGIAQVAVVMNDVVDPKMRAELQEVGIPVYFLDRPQGHRSISYLRTILNLIDTYGVRVVHTHNRGSRYWALLCKFLRRVRVVHTVHDTMTFARTGGIDAAVHRLFVDATVAISEAVQEQCIAAHLRQVVLARNAVDLSRFVPHLPRPDTGILTVMCVGRLFPAQKGQDLLVEAVANLAAEGVHLHCVLVGPETRATSPTCLDELASLAHSRGVSDAVSFMTDCTDVTTVLPQADIFVLPSRMEGFGLAALEAMASGIPTIVPSLPGPASLVDNDRSGLIFRAGDSEDLTRVLRRLASNADLRRTMGQAGRDAARDYDISVLVANYNDLYRRLGAH
jgi:glycosyltransferase involved in cell wall biosynthesis